MQFTQITNNKEIDMTSLILKQMMGEITRDGFDIIIELSHQCFT